MIHDRYSEAREELTRELGRGPTRLEVAAHVGVSRQMVARIYDERGWDVVTTASEERRSRAERDADAIDALDPDEREILLMSRRPGGRLLFLIEERGLDLGEFAVSIGLGDGRREASGRIRKYTHPPAGGSGKVPRVDMLKRWADGLGVDWGYFFQPLE